MTLAAETTVDTTVAIVGAGASGLTLAALLQRAGVDFVVLEARSRSYVEERQRAGVLDHYAGQVYVKAGLTGPILGGVPLDTLLEIRCDGVPRFLNVPELAGGRHSYVVPQQLLVRRLISALADSAADLRFDAADVTLHGIEGPRPRISYRSANGEPAELECDYVAGCDGFHGVSRISIPDGALTTYTFDYDIADAAALAEALVAAQGGDDSQLASYSANCLQRTWNYQEFSRWMTEMVHDAGDDSVTGPFRRQLAKARLDRLFDSPPAAAAFADLMAGIN